MPKTTFEIQKQPKPTKEMPWTFSILEENDEGDPNPDTWVVAKDEGEYIHGICTERGLEHAHDWAMWNYGYTGFRAHLPGEPWEPVF